MKEFVMLIGEYRSGLTDLLNEAQSYGSIVEDVGLEADLPLLGTLIHLHDLPERMLRLSWSRTLSQFRKPFPAEAELDSFLEPGITTRTFSSVGYLAA